LNRSITRPTSTFCSRSVMPFRAAFFRRGVPQQVDSERKHIASSMRICAHGTALWISRPESAPSSAMRVARCSQMTRFLVPKAHDLRLAQKGDKMRSAHGLCPQPYGPWWDSGCLRSNRAGRHRNRLSMRPRSSSPSQGYGDIRFALPPERFG
jgi:hypothetical protein